MHFNLFKDASPPTSERHSIWKPSYPPASFIQPLGQSKPLIPKMETSVLPHKNGLPPPPFLREMLENIGLLLTDYGCTDQQARNPHTTFLLERVPGDGLWLKCRRNAAAIMLTHTFDSVYVLTMDLMHQPFGNRYIRPTLLAESHSHHELAQDVGIDMYILAMTILLPAINTSNLGPLNGIIFAQYEV
ncbi:hypothetical protein IWW34DRAFT_795391 [Fusarium oxysporum f. sp. albedinis]|nr:hypothetical protein IWW34DRAFT_795391 [Fusarium oxysporum f. sp. albedinis]